jgi:hypothetical protein
MIMAPHAAPTGSRGWSQSPPREHGLAGAVGNDDRHHLSGSDVIPRYQGIETVADLEALIEGFDRLKCETSAHLDLLCQRRNRGGIPPNPKAAQKRY